MKYYAVRHGRRPGIYTTWASCEAQVKGFPGALYKAFPTKKQAEAFVAGAPLPAASKRPAATQPATDSVHIWVDGACLHHGDDPMHFGWAYLILDGEQELHRASGHDVPVEAQQHRNVAGEIQAVLHALAWCRDHGIAAATIYFDYQGLASWVQGTWKTKTPFTQSYVEQVRALGLTLTWRKVQAHSGDTYNDIVDRLARDAARAAAVKKSAD